MTRIGGCRLDLLGAWLAASGIAITVAPGIAWCQVVPIGDEFRIESHTTLGTDPPAEIAAAGDGSFIVSWGSYYSLGSDEYSSVQARRFSSAGAPLGDQFQVNSVTTGFQFDPAVAARSDGRFVVVWTSEEAPQYSGPSRHRATGVEWGLPLSASSIRGRLYFADGTPIGPDFPVDGAGVHAASADVAVQPEGDFVVVWEQSALEYGAYEAIFARRFDAAGIPIGPSFQVAGEASGRQRRPAIASDATGAFVVAWQVGSFWPTIEARRFDPAGLPTLDAFEVPELTWAVRPDIAMDTLGRFVVTWETENSAGNDDRNTSVQARLFGVDGAPSGGQFQVNTITSYWQGAPRIAADHAGGFTVTWASQLGDSAAQRFSAGGIALGPEFAVGDPPGYAFSPRVAAEPGGDFTIVWTGLSGLWGRRYAVRVFTGLDAGFESGTACGWDVVVGSPDPCP